MQNSKLNLLLVDDDEDDFYLTSSYLRGIRTMQFEITWAKSFSEALLHLEKCNFDLCFFDFLLGAKTGLDLLKVALQKNVDCPIVLLTGKGDSQIDIEAMRLGAMDYLIKSTIDSEKLDRCIRYAIERSAILKRTQENENRLRRIFAQLKDAIILKRPDADSLFYFNQATLELLGFEEDELMGKSVENLLAFPITWIKNAEKLKEKGIVENLEMWFLRKNGERVLCSMHATIHQDSENQPYYLIVIQDITQRKRAEREYLLSEKSASTARLVRALAHEVRNPLTNIHLALDQLQPELQDEDHKLFADIIRRNGQRINTLITELLNSFRQQETSLQEISTYDLLEEILVDAADRINLKKINLVKNYGSEIILKLDVPKIKIAFLNLIMNSIEAMEENEGILTISTAQSNNSVCIKITDNGTGISEENINRLFEPYFSSKVNGMGLGLTATLSILQSHKATVEVESEVGKGSAFTVVFPIK
ncbi:MAG: PAS domain S-box protein [Arcicella sp.]|nr:PAS domain S-box protein [Arcicella sp.]